MNREKKRAQVLVSQAKVRAEVYAHYGNKCACCGEDNIAFLTLDHIDNDGAKHRQKVFGDPRYGGHFYYWVRANGYPDYIQLLCFNCNMGKARTGGVCPHKLKGG